MILCLLFYDGLEQGGFGFAIFSYLTREIDYNNVKGISVIVI